MRKNSEQEEGATGNHRGEGWRYDSAQPVRGTPQAQDKLGEVEKWVHMVPAERHGLVPRDTAEAGESYDLM